MGAVKIFYLPKKQLIQLTQPKQRNITSEITTSSELVYKKQLIQPKQAENLKTIKKKNPNILTFIDRLKEKKNLR